MHVQRVGSRSGGCCLVDVHCWLVDVRVDIEHVSPAVPNKPERRARLAADDANGGGVAEAGEDQLFALAVERVQPEAEGDEDEERVERQVWRGC